MELEAIKSAGAVQTDKPKPVIKEKVQVQQPRPAVEVIYPNVPVFKQGGKAAATDEGQEEEAAERQLKAAITKVNSKIKSTRTKCEYSYNDTINRVAIKIVDETTGDIIKEIPPEETLKMIEKMWEIAGILMDKKL